MRLALGLQYDGSAFHGWQTQADRHTVQDTLEEALARLAGAPVPTICAGRTDAGVHATCQVVHIDPPAVRPLGAWVRGVVMISPAVNLGRMLEWRTPFLSTRLDGMARKALPWSAA